MSTPEPAIKSYFFGKGYTDLAATIADSWERNLASAREHFARASRLTSTDKAEKALAIIQVTAGISVVVFGTAIFLCASAVHVAVLLAFFLLIYIGFSLVYLAERGYLAWKHFSTVCPECHSKNPLPEYFCPRCGTAHQRLVPSSYGILHHTCTCGERLPATFFLRRGALRARCPECAHLLAGGHTESRKVFVAVVGGPGVGKSAYLLAAVRQLMTEASAAGLCPGFLESRTADDFTRLQEQLAQGRPPDKTQHALPRAFNLQVASAGASPRVLYLYDPAGEAFAETSGLVEHKYQQYLSGMIFLIDPFAIPAVEDEYRDEIARVRDCLRPSTLPVEDALSRVLIGMEEHFGLQRGEPIKVPVAVTVSKIDAFDLDRRLGDQGDADLGEQVREQLVRWGQAGLVQQLEARCPRLRYFTCSALGRMPDGTGRAFEPHRVLEPLAWILTAADPFFTAAFPGGAVSRPAGLPS
jgi:Double-GTPase 2